MHFLPIQKNINDEQTNCKQSKVAKECYTNLKCPNICFYLNKKLIIFLQQMMYWTIYLRGYMMGKHGHVILQKHWLNLAEIQDMNLLYCTTEIYEDLKRNLFDKTPQVTKSIDLQYVVNQGRNGRLHVGMQFQVNPGKSTEHFDRINMYSYLCSLIEIRF